MDTNNTRYDFFTRMIHIGLVVFGITAWLTGDLAEDYERSGDWGYFMHSWIGLALALVILVRLLYGMVGPANIRFSNWIPWTGARLRQAWEDVLTLLRMTLPDRPAHVGLSGLVQALGLLVFFWMALTGSVLYVFIVPGSEASGMLHLVQELHEVGEDLIPVYLVLHVGAVLLHTIFDRSFIRRMF